jgi:4-hydroxybenzoate polyprenyltransferase
MPAWLRVIHPAPAVAVIALSATLAMILAARDGRPFDPRVLLVTISVAGSQFFTGATNDWADRWRDAVARPEKPIPAGDMSAPAALGVAGLGLGIQLGASLPLGAAALAFGAAASASALAYNLWLSRTPASVVPYLLSFGLLPAWIAAGVAIPIERVAGAVILVAPFAAAAHLANTARDYEIDVRSGSRSLAQVLGRRWSGRIAELLALGVGVAVGAAFMVDGRVRPISLALTAIGLVAVGQGIGDARRLWYGMLVAAVCWTAAWGLAAA